MKQFFLFIIILFVFKLSYSIEPKEFNSNLILTDNYQNNTTLTLNENYQQFKLQVVSLESVELTNYANLKKRKKDDKLMLYVAGGIAVATITLILTNNPENFTSNSASGVNLGIAAGGTIACGMIVAKFFIDKKR